jgi:pyruvate,orthophosphate dikinase
VPAEPDPHLEEVLRWADGIRSLGVRANADSADDAARARELGAEGIGLCRTEHMFFGADRDRLVRQTFIAGELARRERMEGDSDRYGREFRQGLVELGEIQRADFREIFMAMEGLPVTIRLLDPPLHEFIPVQAFENDLALAKERGDRQEVAHAERNRRIARDLEEVNPMLGTRGIRLALLLPGLYEMQTGAIIEAALEVEREGHTPRVEIMVPLVAWESELDLMAEAVDSTAADLIEAAGSSLEVSVGTMVELPRTCEVADLVAARADFFSFGTNDLTQTALGLSRDDAERAFLPDYRTRGVVTRNPFETIDTPGVGALIETAVRKGREVNGDLGLGICGEHGGDPDSIAFFHRTGFDYVSCSPFRIPVARVAAAQAAIGGDPANGQPGDS